jgi:hypothetical protein
MYFARVLYHDHGRFPTKSQLGDGSDAVSQQSLFEGGIQPRARDRPRPVVRSHLVLVGID